DHVENVLRAGDDDARDVAVAPPYPGPVAFDLERLAGSVAARLRAAVQPRRVVRERGAIPEEIARGVRPGPPVGQPQHAIGVEREVQAVVVPVAAARGAALETGITARRPEYREPLRLEQLARGQPRRSVRGERGQHLEERPPRETGAGCGRRG